MSIVSLATRHEAALVSMLADFERAGETDIAGYFLPFDCPHARAVSSLAAWSRGEELALGWVPCTTLFYEEGDALLGLYNFRHQLSPQLELEGGHVGYSVRPTGRGRGIATALLSAARVFAHARGIESLLLTCDTTNLASKRVIEKNGGLLRDTYPLPKSGRLTHRFDVPTT